MRSHSMTKFRAGIAVAAIGAGVAVSATTLSASAESRPRPARVTGSADVRLTFAPDQDVRTFTFDAVARPYSRPMPGADTGLPTDATGTVRVSHKVAGTGQTVTFAAKVDCLVTTPRDATLTAVVYQADHDARDLVGQRLGFSVYDGDGGRDVDRVGFSWAVVNADQNEAGEWQQGRPGTCMAPAAYAPVTRGDYQVRHKDLPLIPKS